MFAWFKRNQIVVLMLVGVFAIIKTTMQVGWPFALGMLGALSIGKCIVLVRQSRHVRQNSD